MRLELCTTIPTKRLRELERDRARLNALQKDIRKEPLMLHNCSGSDEWPKHPRGLGLLCGKRTLRRAIDECFGT